MQSLLAWMLAYAAGYPTVERQNISPPTTSEIADSRADRVIDRQQFSVGQIRFAGVHPLVKGTVNGQLCDLEGHLYS